MLQEFAQEIESTVRAEIENIHTSIPGKIVDFNVNSGTATVKPYGRFKFNGEYKEIPAISEVPVMFPYSNSSGIGIAFPVLAGDDCMLLISEVELDEWRNGAKTIVPLKFDFTSAVAILGLCKIPSQSMQQATKDKAVIISSGPTTLSISEKGLVIKGNVEINGNIKADNI
jgi:hypothetical protein